MNKFTKFILAVLGGINNAFSIFYPLALSLTIVTIFNLNSFFYIFLIIIGVLTSFYKAITVWFLKK